MGVNRALRIELEISRTQVNKATTTHLGLLRAQLSRLRTQVVIDNIY